MRTHWIDRVYLALLALFPAKYQEEYGEELEYAIRMAVEQSQAKGRVSVIRLALRELRDLPIALLRAHLDESRGRWMNIQPGAHLPDGPIKNWKLAALFVPFLIPLLGAVLGFVDRLKFGWLPQGVGYLLFGLLVVTWVVGLMKGFPAWALPGMGLILFLFGYPLKLGAQFIILEAARPPGYGYWPDSITERLILYIWFNLAYVAIAALIVAFLLEASTPFLQRVRKDWSLLSFLVFGLSIPYVIMNDEYHRGLAPFELASILILAAGAAIFLIVPGRWQRLLALFLAALLAHPVLSLGIYQIYPAQEFATPVLSFRVWEALQPVLDLPALAILLCLPALLPLLPASFGHKLATSD
jgi:hypothetical protein